MDKQKQIEEKKEIAKELDKVYPNAKFTNGWIAEVLYKLGYRKITEDEVVLTREEYERLQALKDDYVKGYEAGVSEGLDNVREEMAEKFAKRLKEEFDYDEILCSTVDRIVKEITEGEGIEIYKQGFKEGVEALKIQAKERKFEIVTDAGNREDVVFVEDIDEIVKELCE